MTPKDRKVLSAYVRKVADAMNLRDWTIYIAHGTDNEGVAAHVTTLYGRHTATVTFRDDFRTADPEFQRMAVVHELIHVPLNAQSWLIVKTLRSLIGSAAYDAFSEAYDQLDEMATDTLATAFAPGFPLIDWPAAPTVVK